MTGLMELVLENFVLMLDQKLRTARFELPSKRFGLRTDREKRLGRYLEWCDSLKRLEADRLVVDAIPVEYIKMAAMKAFNEELVTTQQRLQEALCELLQDWGVVGAIAKTLTSKALWDKKHKSPEETEAGQSLTRYFVHVTVKDGVSPEILFENILNEWGPKLGDSAVLEECGWLDGEILTPGDRIDRGIYLIVQARDEVVEDLKALLVHFGSRLASSSLMLEITLPSGGFGRNNG